MPQHKNGTVVTLSVARPCVSGETLRAVDYIRQEVLAGRIVGLAWAAVRPGYRWEVDLAGQLLRDAPAFTQGIVLNLLREIGELPATKK